MDQRANVAAGIRAIFNAPISLFAVFPLAAALTAGGIAAMLLAKRQPVAGPPARVNGAGGNPG